MNPVGATKKPFTRPIAQSVLKVAQRKAASQLDVFIAGPYVDVTWGPEERTNKTPGAQLRLEVIEFVQRLEHRSVLGEHKGVSEVTEDNIPTQASIALSELELVGGADAIVIIPDSPGSFCELGAWSIRDDLCPKTLILGNLSYQSSFSYVGNGVFPMAEHLHATVAWIDYTNRDEACKIVERFLSQIQDRIVSRMLRRGR